MASTSSSRTSSSSRSLNHARRRSSAEHQRFIRGDYTYAVDDTSISEWLKCPICLNPFLQPVQASTCEHIFCNHCIKMHCISSHKNQQQEEEFLGNDSDENTHGESQCPTCRSILKFSDLKPAATLIRNMVDSLLVKCPHQRRGCLYTCERSLIETHASRDCGWAWVGEYKDDDDTKVVLAGRGRCDCGKRILRKDWSNHLKEGECIIERQPCIYEKEGDGCTEMLKEDEVEEHQAKCPARPVHCPHCEIMLQHRDLDSHNDECSEAPTLCVMAKFGCKWKDCKKDLESKHLPICSFALLEPFLVRNEQEVQDLRRDNVKLTLLCNNLREEYEKMTLLLKSCLLSLGSTYLDASDNAPLNQTSANSDRVMPSHLEQLSELPPGALRGRSCTTLELSTIPNTASRYIVTNIETSASAPASRANLPWQWPESSTIQSVTVEIPKKTISESIADLQREFSSLNDKMKHFDRRIEDNHVGCLNANFEASRAHEELNSVRHGLHGLRISLLMQQQQQQPRSTLSDGRTGEAMLANIGTQANTIPYSPGNLAPPLMGMRRFWPGYEQTKL